MYKRKRAIYEADLQTQQSPFVAFGTPLPPADPDVRDDGSYVPLWKQEVTDEKGRKRLHGAFTGGFSAGYFNTVGSKEGWTPATFVSSRSNRKKDDAKAPWQRAEDFMDDEDLADAADAQKLQLVDGFTALGSLGSDSLRQGNLPDLFKVEEDTIGVKLLKKMGWREGQGIGPKVRRKARLEGSREEEATHLFAPEDTPTISIIKKNDSKGLRFQAETSLSSQGPDSSAKSDDDEDTFRTAPTTMKAKNTKPISRSGTGTGIFNDTGSDDEDPYEIGPRTSYNKVIGANKKKRQKPQAIAPNAISGMKPVFISKKVANKQSANGFRKCHDGRLPIDGFVLDKDVDGIATSGNFSEKYEPPIVPEGWVSAKKLSSERPADYVPHPDAAKASKLNPTSRGAILGETRLPGKSVFDFLSSFARNRLAAASGKSDLPIGKGEVPEGYALTAKDRRKELQSQIPKLDHNVAIAALGRGASGWMPYAEDESKRARYRDFLENQSGIQSGDLEKPTGISKDEWLQELREFAHCANIFKPMTGMMATRFTTSSTAPKAASDTESLITKAMPKVEDPAEAASKLGIYGPMTRSTQDFYPSRLLCKRFGVKPPAHVQLDHNRATDDTGNGSGLQTSTCQPRKNLEMVSKSALDDMLRENSFDNRNVEPNQSDNLLEAPKPAEAIVIEPERNEALEGQRAGEAIFKAIFGDSDDED